MPAAFPVCSGAQKYLNAFLQVLDEEGISYTVGEAEPTGLPGIQLPVPHAG